jgi:hypothetical protein
MVPSSRGVATSYSVLLSIWAYFHFILERNTKILGQVIELFWRVKTAGA